MKVKKIMIWIAVLGIAALENNAEGVHFNHEQMALIEKGLITEEDAISKEAHQNAVESLELANNTILSSQNSIVSIAEALGVEIPEGDFNAEELTASISASISELKATSSEDPTTVDPTGDPEVSKVESTEEILSNLPHYPSK